MTEIPNKGRGTNPELHGFREDPTENGGKTEIAGRASGSSGGSCVLSACFSPLARPVDLRDSGELHRETAIFEATTGVNKCGEKCGDPRQKISETERNREPAESGRNPRFCNN